MQSLLLAQVANAPLGREVTEISDLVVPATVALVVLAFGAIALGVAWTLMRRSTGSVEVNPNALLSDFRSLHERGELTEEEYRRLRMVLDNKIRRQSGMAEIEREKLEPISEVGDEGDEEFEWREIDLEELGESTKSKQPEES